VHRDIKPANIFLCRQGDVLLLDLGVAWAAGYFPLTTPGETVGTQPYLAFEQIAHPEEIDGRADVFSLGLVLAEMVAGPKALPWYENLDPEEVLGALQRRPPLHRLAPWLPRALTDIIETACQLDPAGRYQSMNEFRGLLVALLDKEKERQQRLAERQRRKRRMLLGAAAVGIYAAGLATGGLLGELRLQRQLQMRPLPGVPCEAKSTRRPDHEESSAASASGPSQTLPNPTQESPMKNFVRAAGAAAGIMAATGAASRPSTAHAKPQMCQTDADCKKKEACKSAGSLGNWCAQRDEKCAFQWRFTKRAAEPPKGQCWIEATEDGSDTGRLY
jgi:serine/threonine protein kinase